MGEEMRDRSTLRTKVTVRCCHLIFRYLLTVNVDGVGDVCTERRRRSRRLLER
jgi:hypothetical protein